MTFITTKKKSQEDVFEIEKPPMPALQSIFYWLAFLTLIGGFIPFRMEARLEIALGAACAFVFTAILLFGFGQVIGYLGQTAHYTRKTYEHLQNNSAQNSPIPKAYE